MSEDKGGRERGRFVTLLTWTVWRALREHLKVPACILRSRVLQLVGEEVGVKFEPVPCRLLVLNPVYATYWRAFGRLDHSAEERAALDAVGAWSVMVGYGPDTRTGWGGHLVCAAGDWLCDPSAPDADRPERDVRCPPLTVGGFAGGLAREGGLWAELPNGGIALYLAHPEASENWRTAPDWTRRRAYRARVREIVRTVRAVGRRRGA